MRYDDLITPISPDAPCGPDLLENDDDDFLDYYFGVEDRFPTSYYNLATNTLFDSKTVDHKAESAQIDGLLKKSRDLRLLGIEAKFQILAGRFGGFVEALRAMAGLLETFPEDVHPQITEDNIDRRNALEELDTMATVVTPLDYAVLMTDRRFGDITYRAYATGTGKAKPREDEEPGDSAGIIAVLSNSEGATAVDKLHEQMETLKGALATIASACQSCSQPFTPKLDRLEARVGEIHDMVLSARSDLGGGDSSDNSGEAPAAEGGAAPAAAAGGGAAQVMVALPQTAVPDHKAARQTLEAVERYFARNEPAAVALLLVTQSRLLVGRPLVEAMDALLETSSEEAVIALGSESGFKISMSRMRELSDQVEAGPDDEEEDDSSYEEPMAEEGPAEDDHASADNPDSDETGDDGDDTGDAAPAPAPPPPPAPPKKPEFIAPLIQTRDQAGQALKLVEEFYQVREPASPIPILLFKARNMLNKDFHAIVRELLPPEPEY